MKNIMKFRLWGASMLMLYVLAGAAHAGVKLDAKDGIWISSGGRHYQALPDFDSKAPPNAYFLFGIEGPAPSGEPLDYNRICGIFDGTKFIGRMLTNQGFSIVGSDRGDCSKADWKTWKNYLVIRLTLSADGNTLSGEWSNPRLGEETRQLSGKSAWVPISFNRRTPLPTNVKPVDRPKVEAKPVPKPAVPKPVTLPPPAELPKVETSPPAPPAPAPVVPPPEPANGKNLALGAGLLAVLAVVFFFIRNAYVHYLVGSLKRAPNDANLAGWALFGGFLFASAMGSLALANSEWLTGPVLGALGGLSAACFGLCAMTSRKK